MRVLTYVGLALAALVILPWDVGLLPGPMFHNTTATASDQPLDTPAYTRRVLQFPCSGVMCQAWFYMPKQPEGKPPVIVAAHGVGCQKEFGLAPYGDRFAKAGFAVFIFDYRTFGGSEGTPRHWASPSRHCEDYVSAVRYIKASLSDEVDVNRLNLWGTSFSGGHVLTLAGTQLRDNVTAVVAQVPLVDGMSFLAENFKRRPLVVVRAILAGLHDALRSLFNYPPAYIPLTGERGSFSLLDITPEDAKAFYGLHPQQRQGGWRNQVRAMIALEATYRPLAHVGKIRAPVLYLAATEDTLLPLDLVVKAVKHTPDARMFKTKGGHFSVYGGIPFPFMVQHAVGFLRDSNGMKHIIMSSLEAAGHGRPRPAVEHKSQDPGAGRDEIHEEREAIVETAAEL